jgi:hypothetical protein
MQKLFVFLVGAAALAQNAPDHPSITARGKTFRVRVVYQCGTARPEKEVEGMAKFVKQRQCIYLCISGVPIDSLQRVIVSIDINRD